MRKYYSSDPVVARAMEEYDSDSYDEEKEEPLSGYYVQEDYDEINSNSNF